MLTKVTFHEIHSLGSSIHEERVITPLPFEIMKGVTIEEVSSWLNDETLDWVSRYIGIYATEALKNVRFALVHSYAADSSVRGTNEEIESEKLVRNLVELVHIIRPMRQNTSIVRGERGEDKSFRVVHLDTPNQLEVPVPTFSFLRGERVSQPIGKNVLFLWREDRDASLQAGQPATNVFPLTKVFPDKARIMELMGRLEIEPDDFGTEPVVSLCVEGVGIPARQPLGVKPRRVTRDEDAARQVRQ